MPDHRGGPMQLREHKLGFMGYFYWCSDLSLFSLAREEIKLKFSATGIFLKLLSPRTLVSCAPREVYASAGPIKEGASQWET